MKVIMFISNRILAINFSQPITEGTPKEIAKNPKVIEALEPWNSWILLLNLWMP